MNSTLPQDYFRDSPYLASEADSISVPPVVITPKLIDFTLHRESDWIDQLTRELHIRIAAKILLDINLLGIPLHNLRLWKKTATPQNKPLLRRWKLILMTWTPEEIIEFLVSDTKESRELRRCSPFCGVLNAQEIASVWQGAETYHPVVKSA